MTSHLDGYARYHALLLLAGMKERLRAGDPIAKRWAASDDLGPGDFREVCDEADLEYDAVRRAWRTEGLL